VVTLGSDPSIDLGIDLGIASPAATKSATRAEKIGRAWHFWARRPEPPPMQVRERSARDERTDGGPMDHATLDALSAIE